MISVSETDARANLETLLDKVKAGEEVLVTRSGKPVARIVPIPRKPLALEELAAFRATMPSLGRPSAEILREIRDEED
jgi:prevent-host-death family protein